MKPIILAGPDGEGKTTFARELAEKYKLNYFRGDKDNYHNKRIQYYIFENVKDTIIDRSFLIDDPVYNSLEGKKSGYYHKSLPLLNAIIVFNDTPTELIVSRLMSRDDIPNSMIDEVTERTEAIKLAYKKFFKKFAIETVTNAQLINMLEEEKACQNQ